MHTTQAHIQIFTHIKIYMYIDEMPTNSNENTARNVKSHRTKPRVQNQSLNNVSRQG